MGIEEVGMHDNMSLTQSEEPNPRRTLQNLKPDRKNQQRGLTGSIPGLMEHERIAAFLFPRSSSHPSPNSSQVFAAMQLPRVGGWGRGGGGALSREPQQTVVRRGPTFVSRPGLPVAASRGE